MARPVLIIVHQERSTPGRVGQVLARNGYALDVRKPALGDPLPQSLQDHEAAIIFGGPMSANDVDTLSYIATETRWIEETALPSGQPFLGICLGAQMLARALGGTVAPHEEGHVESGYYQIRPTGAGRGLFDDPQWVYQWHREGFSLPRDAVLLAEGDMYPNQAFRYGSDAYGIQFHPELTPEIMHRWVWRGRERLNSPGAQPRHEHFRKHRIHDHMLEAWLERFLRHWLKNGDVNGG